MSARRFPPGELLLFPAHCLYFIFASLARLYVCVQRRGYFGGGVLMALGEGGHSCLALEMVVPGVCVCVVFVSFFLFVMTDFGVAVCSVERVYIVCEYRRATVTSACNHHW